MQAVDKKPREMTAKQRKFAEAFAVHRNGVKAYREAYRQDASSNTAAVQAFHTLRNPNVYAEVKRLEADALTRNGITKDRILQELSALAFSDITQTEGVPLEAMSQLPKNVRAALQKAKKTLTLGGYTEEVVMHPKMPALMALADMAGLTEQQKVNIDASTTNTLNIQVNVVRPNHSRADISS